MPVKPKRAFDHAVIAARSDDFGRLVMGRQGVVAGGILLSDADTLLRGQRLGRSGVAVLFDDADRIVAHPRMSALIEQNQADATLTLPWLSAVYKSGIPAAARAWQSGGSPQQFFEGDDGRTYVASFRSIETANSAHLRLAVLAPLDEFFATVLAQQQFLFLMALAFVAAALPPVFWLGSMLSRSISAIAVETGPHSAVRAGRHRGARLGHSGNR
jgi:adenylate cyclase